MNKVFIVIFIIVGISIFQSCEEPVRTVLTKEEKDIVDSLYAIQAGNVRKRADSICDAMYPDLFDAAKDSFYMISLREINQIINGDDYEN